MPILLNIANLLDKIPMSFTVIHVGMRITYPPKRRAYRELRLPKEHILPPLIRSLRTTHNEHDGQVHLRTPSARRPHGRVPPGTRRQRRARHAPCAAPGGIHTARLLPRAIPSPCLNPHLSEIFSPQDPAALLEEPLRSTSRRNAQLH